MEVNSVVNDIALPVGENSVRKVTNELDWATEIGCGDSTNSISSSIYSSAPVGSKPAAAQFIHGERIKVTDGPSETGGPGTSCSHCESRSRSAGFSLSGRSGLRVLKGPPILMVESAGPFIVQKRRRTIGQLMEKCEVVNGAPGGKPVSRPSCTRVRMVNSSLSCPRKPLLTASSVHVYNWASHAGL